MKMVLLLVLLTSFNFMGHSEEIETNSPPIHARYNKLKEWTRTFDGTKNNPRFANWGAAGRPELRLCENSYTDGLSAMRTDLPNPR